MTVAAHIELTEGTTPSTPATSAWQIYPKSDGWYIQDDAGTESKLTSAADNSVSRQAIQTATTTVADTVTETTLFGTVTGSLAFAANALTVGKTIKIRMGGIMSDTGTPDVNFRIKLGSTEIVSTGNITLAGTMSNNAWRAECDITVISTGATGTVFGTGFVFLDTNAATNGLTNSSSATAAVTIDTTGTLALDVTAEWDTANAGNTITTHVAYVEIVQ